MAENLVEDLEKRLKKLEGYLLRKELLIEVNYRVPYGITIEEDAMTESDVNGVYREKLEDGREGNILIGPYTPTGDSYYFNENDRDDLDQYIQLLEYGIKKDKKKIARQEKKAQRTEKLKEFKAKFSKKDKNSDEGR